jgi:hypothetical protein
VIAPRDLAAGLYGAWRLARLDPGGMAHFDASAAGAWRSLAAVALTVPLNMVLFAVRYRDGNVAADLGRYLALNALGMLIAWLAFLLVMAAVCDMIGRRRHYLGYVCAYNWAGLLQALVFVPADVLRVSGVLPPRAGQFVVLVVFAACLAYSWYVTRTALEADGLTAATVVIGDLIFSIAITSLAFALV